MPQIRDKIIINGNGDRANDCVSEGYCDGLEETYKAADLIAFEIEDRGWLLEPEALKFLDKQTGICKKYRQAQRAFQDAQREHLRAEEDLIDEMRVWVDKKIASIP